MNPPNDPRPEPRTLRSRQLRALLWYAAKGRCQKCDRPLDPTNWHADHTVSWANRPETNVHRMQALCVHCNLVKGCH
jgi:5-methylcytosine-specific restriction endonuclease McrA